MRGMKGRSRLSGAYNSDNEAENDEGKVNHHGGETEEKEGSEEQDGDDGERGISDYEDGGEAERKEEDDSDSEFESMRIGDEAIQEGNLQVGEEDEEDSLALLYKEISEENKRLTEANNELQTRLGEYFRDQKIDDVRERDKSVNHEHRFNKILTQVQEWQAEQRHITNYYEDTILDMKVKLEEKADKGNEVRVSFAQFMREIAKESEYSRTGKKMQEKEIDQIEQADHALDRELEVVRLKNIMLKNHLQQLEKTLNEKEKLKDGLHLIDFEQLKIENQTFNEKIEERNEELQKLRKKINNTVQVLTHLKEKLQFVQAENQQLKKQLTDLDSSVTSNRDSLGRMKQQRDVVRVENNGLRQASGLIGLDGLLRDYEQCMNQLAASKDKLQGLKDKHAILTMETVQYQQPNNNKKPNKNSSMTRKAKSNHYLPPLTPK